MQITTLTWGHMEVKIGEEIRQFKDSKLWPGGGRAWNWRETGMQHNPGIQPADIEEILAHAPDVIILGRGVFGRLGVCPETEALLQEKGILYHIEKTKKAVELFNALNKQGQRVGGLFHSTC